MITSSAGIENDDRFGISYDPRPSSCSRRCTHDRDCNGFCLHCGGCRWQLGPSNSALGYPSKDSLGGCRRQHRCDEVPTTLLAGVRRRLRVRGDARNTVASSVSPSGTSHPEVGAWVDLFELEGRSDPPRRPRKTGSHFERFPGQRLRSHPHGARIAIAHKTGCGPLG